MQRFPRVFSDIERESFKSLMIVNVNSILYYLIKLREIYIIKRNILTIRERIKKVMYVEISKDLQQNSRHVIFI